MTTYGLTCFHCSIELGHHRVTFRGHLFCGRDCASGWAHGAPPRRSRWTEGMGTDHRNSLLDEGCGGPCVRSVECPFPRCIFDGYKPPGLVRLDSTRVTSEWES